MSKEYPSRQREEEIKLSQKKKTKDLFEDLARLSGCEYVADLKLRKNEKVIKALQEVVVTEYSLHDWKDAAEYLVGENLVTDDREEIQKIIISKYLKKHVQA